MLIITVMPLYIELITISVIVVGVVSLLYLLCFKFSTSIREKYAIINKIGGRKTTYVRQGDKFVKIEENVTKEDWEEVNKDFAQVNEDIKQAMANMDKTLKDLEQKFKDTKNDKT